MGRRKESGHPTDLAKGYGHTDEAIITPDFVQKVLIDMVSV